MNPSNIALFQHINGFSAADSASVQEISPVLIERVPQLPDKFYAQLCSHP